MVVHPCNTSPTYRRLCDLASLACVAGLRLKEDKRKLKVGERFLNPNKLRDASPSRLFQMKTLEPRADQLPRASGQELVRLWPSSRQQYLPTQTV